MLKAYKRFFEFSSQYKKEWEQAGIYEILKNIFEALQFLAIMVSLVSILSNQMMNKTALYAFGIMLISILGSIICWNKAHTKEGIASYRTCEEKRIEIGNRLKYMPMGFFSGHRLGNITAVATTTMQDMQDMAFAIIVRTLTGVIYSLIMSIGVLIFDWRIGIILILGTITFIVINGFLLKKSEEVSPVRIAAQTNLVDAALEYIQGMGVVKAFHLAESANISLNHAIDLAEQKNLEVEHLRIPYIAAENAILHICTVLASFVAIALYITGRMELSLCILMIICNYMMYNRLFAAGKMFFMLPMIIASIERVEEVQESPVIDINGKNISPEKFDIELKDVTFGYEATPVINNVSLRIPEKTTLAVVGPSGSGKTTLCSLIPRFWDVTSGNIKLGGIDIRRYSLDSLLKNFSIVFQDVYLFHDTIENNIKFGKPNATHEEVVRAAKQACCHEFILALPEGYQTMLGEGGATVSGGEKQRISIARAILKDAPIIILDEATANVDPENEEQLNHAIEALTHNKTVIMIAHRMKTIKNANQIIVLDKGEIVQQGTHEALIHQPGIYARFVLGRQKAENWKLSNTSCLPVGGQN